MEKTPVENEGRRGEEHPTVHSSPRAWPEFSAWGGGTCCCDKTDPGHTALPSRRVCSPHRMRSAVIGRLPRCRGRAAEGSAWPEAPSEPASRAREGDERRAVFTLVKSNPGRGRSSWKGPEARQQVMSVPFQSVLIGKSVEYRKSGKGWGTAGTGMGREGLRLPLLGVCTFSCGQWGATDKRLSKG